MPEEPQVTDDPTTQQAENLDASDEMDPIVEPPLSDLDWDRLTHVTKRDLARARDVATHEQARSMADEAFDGELRAEAIRRIDEAVDLPYIPAAAEPHLFRLILSFLVAARDRLFTN